MYIDVNECWLYPDKVCYPSKVYCQNNLNFGYECKCPSGSSPHLNDVTNHGKCLDTDECETGTHKCPDIITMCENIFGGFICNCVSGYETISGASETKDCVDIETCSADLLDCKRHDCLLFRKARGCSKYWLTVCSFTL